MPAAHPCPGQRGSLASHTAQSGAPRALHHTKPGSSDCSPFFRRKKFQLTSLEAGLGPEPKNALGSQVLTHCSQLGSLARETATQQECAELLQEDLGAWGPALLLQPAPRPSQGSVRAAVNTSHVRYKRCPRSPSLRKGNADAISCLLCRLCRQTSTHSHPSQDVLFIMLSTFHFSLQIIPAPSSSPRHILPCQMICDRLMTYYIVIAAKLSKQGC